MLIAMPYSYISHFFFAVIARMANFALVKDTKQSPKHSYEYTFIY